MRLFFDLERLSLSPPLSAAHDRFYKPLLNNWHRLRWLLLLLAILVHAVYAYYDSQLITSDIGTQIGAVYNLLDGHGYTVTRVFNPQDLAAVEYRALFSWPPGYSVMLAPLLLLTNDVWWAANILDWLFIILFFVAWFIILEQLPGIFTPGVRLFIWFFWIVIYAPIFTTTNHIAAALYIASLAVFIRGFTHNGSLTGSALLAGVLVAIAALTRYAYLPLIAVMPLALIFYSFFQAQRRRLLWGLALAYGTIGLLPSILLLIHNQVTAGQTTVLEARSRAVGFFTENLLTFTPFPLHSMNLDYALRAIVERLTVPYTLYNLIAWGIALLMLVIFTTVILSGLWRGWQQRPVQQRGDLFFMIVSLLSVIVVVAELSVLAVRYEGREADGWAFVGEPRYYAPILGMIFVMLVVSASGNLPGRWIKRLRVPAIAVLVLAVVLGGMVRIANVRYLAGQGLLSGGVERLDKQPFQVVYTARQETEQPVIMIAGYVFDTINIQALTAAANGRYFNAPVTDDIQPGTSEPVTVILGIPDDVSGRIEEIRVLRDLNATYQGEPVGSIPGHMAFYRFDLLPD